MDDRLLPQRVPAVGRGGRPWWVWAGLALLVAGLAGAWWWLRSPVPAAPAPVAVAEQPVEAEAPAASAPPPVAHPLAEAPASAPAGLTLTAALEALFGRQVLMTLFQLDGFAARVVVTVDNLGRDHAAPRHWPLVPVAGRFSVEPRGAASVVSAANARRYDAHLRLMDQVPVAQLTALYVAHYPRFQQAYEELGYPGHYFNDRLVQVIDTLLATPAPSAAPTLHLPEIHGPVPPPRPWVMYTYDDDALQALAAGQRLLLRLSPAQRARVQAWLRVLREGVVAQAGSDSTRSR